MDPIANEKIAIIPATNSESNTVDKLFRKFVRQVVNF